MLTTKDADHLVAGVLVAKQQTLVEHEEAISTVLAKLLESNNEIRNDATKAIRVLSRVFPDTPASYFGDLFAKTKLASHVDNIGFLDSSGKGRQPSCLNLFHQAQAELSADDRCDGHSFIDGTHLAKIRLTLGSLTYEDLESRRRGCMSDETAKQLLRDALADPPRSNGPWAFKIDKKIEFQEGKAEFLR